MGTINGIPTRQARQIGEMCNVTSYTRAECTAYLLVDADHGGWMDRVRPVAISLTLMPGYGLDHLFDRAAERIMGAVEGRLYRTLKDLLTAASKGRAGAECGVKIDTTVASHYLPVPAELEAQAEAIREAIRADDARKDRRAKAKEVAGMRVFSAGPAGWVILPQWAGSVQACGPTAYYSVRIWDGGKGYSYQAPSTPHATREEAESYLAEIRRLFG